MRLGQSKLTFIKAADAKIEPMRFFWRPQIPKGELTLLQGDPGLGKSFFLCALLSVASNPSRQQLIGSTEVEEIHNGFFFSAEDSHSIVRSRLETMGAKLDRVLLHSAYFHTDGKEQYFSFVNDAAVEAFDLSVAHYRPELIVIDPLISYLSGANTHQEYSLRPLLDILSHTAHKYDTTIVASIHLNKGDSKALYRAQGNIQFGAAARSVLMMAQDPRDTDERVLMHIKANYGKLGTSVNFSILDNEQDKPYIQWGDEGKWHSIDDLLSEDYTPEDKEAFGRGFTIGFNDGSKASGGVLDVKKLDAAAKVHGVSPEIMRKVRKQQGWEKVSTLNIGENK